MASIEGQPFINLSVLIRKGKSGIAELSEVKAALDELNLQVVSHGRVSLTCRVTPENFVKVFGGLPEELKPLRSAAADFGAAGGHSFYGELEVPPSLQALVSQICIEPPSTRFSS